MEKILIVEDDQVMLRGLKDNFEYNGFRVSTATDGETGLDRALSEKPDLILLDLMLPKINGYEICRLLRREGLDMPILILTAKSQESDIVLGLDLGADDYIIKPFSIRELLARVEAFLRRRRKQEKRVYVFGDFALNIESHVLTKDDEVVKLSPKEFKLLHFFLQNEGRALSRDAIMNSVWGYDSQVTSRSIDRFVTTLRNKLESDPAQPQFIHTIRELGYKFTAE